MGAAAPELLIKTSEARWLQSIREIAYTIADHRQDTPLILLSGPSGSGKTTTALMLEKMLDSMNVETHTLSSDNFFKTMTSEEIAAAKAGKLNLESPERMDVDLLNETLQSLIDGKETPIPKYDFVTSKQTDNDGKTLKRKPGEILLIEGIHMLNPNVITIPENESVRLYVSVRTRLQMTGGRLLHPSLVRLSRRLLRDKTHRGRSFEETMRMYRDVEKGEQDFIAPYKKRATWNIDTFMDSEMSIYKPMLLNDLKNTVDPLASEILYALDELSEIDSKLLPEDSLLQEFIN